MTPDVRVSERVDDDPPCECGHDASFHFHISGKCMRFVGVHPSNARCDCAAFRPRFPVPEEGGR